MWSLLVVSHPILFTRMYFCFISKTHTSFECCQSCCTLGSTMLQVHVRVQALTNPQAHRRTPTWSWLSASSMSHFVSSIHPTSRSHPARTQQRRRFCCRSRCRLLLLLTCLLLDARPALYCNCRLAIHVRASDFVLCLASSISTATPFPCACRKP